MRVALIEARKALERGDFPVGCVIVDKGKIVSAGQRANSSTNNEMDHAEIVALRNLYAANHESSGDDLVIYSTMEPCLMCYSTLILNRVRKIVYGYEDVMGGGTNLALKELKPLYAGMKVEVTSGILREECLQLFQKFFREEKNSYWRDSLLASYTLNQECNRF